MTELHLQPLNLISTQRSQLRADDKPPQPTTFNYLLVNTALTRRRVTKQAVLIPILSN